VAAVVVVVLAAAAWAFVPKLLAGEPTLTEAQMQAVVSDPGLGARGLQWRSGPEQNVPDNASCQKILAIETTSMRGYFDGSATHESGAASVGWLGVFDSPTAASDSFALIVPCNTERGGSAPSPVTVEGRGAWLVVKSPGVDVASVAVRYGNLVAVASSDAAPDPEAFLKALVTAVERARLG